MATYLNNVNVNITTLANNRRDFINNGADNGSHTGCINYGSFNDQIGINGSRIVENSDSKQIILANVTSVPKFTYCINNGHMAGVQQAQPQSKHSIKTESTNINENILIPLANTNTVSNCFVDLNFIIEIVPFD